eukprot:CAMPEP_0172438194 /NCGR_PEP_ID=MMETSP1064-20121228/72671_1 /TAXON_ID=202472 /ORGANISM="Aulacoseira subarctica , Strain CCAP 1002/5" /LENGTH=100 /DNA_ID=CAMNT_0013186735 /DNA_START=389 /DNA_END=688 /DNA_ORIENTATION=-
MEDSFDNVLDFVVGLSQPQHQFLIEQNITNESISALLDEDAVSDLFTKRAFANASIVNKMRLKAFRIWIQDKEDADIEYDIEDFTEEECNNMMKKMSRKS